MKSIAAYSRSINETHRICTHDISGHLHLLRFCMDEINENEGQPTGALLERLDQGIEKLEELNKLLKICTRYYNPEEAISADSITEKALGLTQLYHYKFLKDINYEVVGSEVFNINDATMIIEALFGVCSTICHFAAEKSLSEMKLSIRFSDSSVLVESPIGKIKEEDILELLESGNENDKTLRRAYAHELLTENGAKIEYSPSDSQISVRIEL